eukprot:s2893_g3.t1
MRQPVTPVPTCRKGLYAGGGKLCAIQALTLRELVCGLPRDPELCNGDCQGRVLCALLLSVPFSGSLQVLCYNHAEHKSGSHFEGTNLPAFTLTTAACALPAMGVMDLPPPSLPLKLNREVSSDDSAAVGLQGRMYSLCHNFADCSSGCLDEHASLVEKGPGASYMRWTEPLPFQDLARYLHRPDHPSIPSADFAPASTVILQLACHDCAPCQDLVSHCHTAAPRCPSSSPAPWLHFMPLVFALHPSPPAPFASLLPCLFTLHCSPFGVSCNCSMLMSDFFSCYSIFPSPAHLIHLLVSSPLLTLMLHTALATPFPEPTRTTLNPTLPRKNFTPHLFPVTAPYFHFNFLASALALPCYFCLLCPPVSFLVLRLAPTPVRYQHFLL